jgi:hypothetical protein
MKAEVSKASNLAISILRSQPSSSESFPVTGKPSVVWAACKKVPANHGVTGIDTASMENFEANQSKYLFKIRNRMAAGSFLPPAIISINMLCHFRRSYN